MSKVKALQQLLRPNTIAVFGGDSAAEVIRQCRRMGFSGKIWAVNPNRTELAGVKCVTSVTELPAVPDASFIATPPEVSLRIVRELAAVGAPGVVCFAAGFAETGTEGAALQGQLRAAAGDMAVMGPNCHGFLNYVDKVALWPDEFGGRSCDEGVAVISQSGNIAINLTMQQRGLDFSYMISAGNCSALDVHDYIEALLEDDRVTVIGLLLEAITDVAAFSRAAIAALEKGVPIVAFKNGRSARGAEITLSHTGSMAGSDRLYTALFTRLGIVRCDTLSQFLETMKFLSVVGVLPGNSIGSLSCSGGDASIVADNAAILGLETPPLDDASARQLRELLGPSVAVTNPLDYHLYIWGQHEKLKTCFELLLGNAFGCTLLVLDYPPGEDNDDTNWQVAERALTDAAAKTGQRAVVVSSLPETMTHQARARLKNHGVAPMQGIEDCLFAIRGAALIGRVQSRVDSVIAVAEPSPAVGNSLILDEWEGKQSLGEYGVCIPRGTVSGRDDIQAAAELTGFPVVLKALSPELIHKTDAGAVAVNLRNATELEAAARKMADRFDRFIVEEMVAPIVAELIVGIHRDATFGLTLLIGSGGTLVELLDDSVLLLLPVQRSDVEAAIRSLKVNELINGYRGAPAGNRTAVIDAVLAIADFAAAGDLLEVDVNPLLVTPERAIAADVLIRRCVA